MGGGHLLRCPGRSCLQETDSSLASSPIAPQHTPLYAERELERITTRSPTLASKTIVGSRTPGHPNLDGTLCDPSPGGVAGRRFLTEQSQNRWAG